jgi:hypothetical protein
MHPDDAKRLGDRLYAERFLPLPDVADNGQLIGTRLWRLGDDYVEFLAIRPNGLALAVRADAQFSYRTPAAHGPVRESVFGAASTALDWLLGLEQPASSLRRYVNPDPPSGGWASGTRGWSAPGPHVVVIGCCSLSPCTARWA